MGKQDPQNPQNLTQITRFQRQHTARMTTVDEQNTNGAKPMTAVDPTLLSKPSDWQDKPNTGEHER